LTIRGVADVVHVFVDGQLMATSQTPIEARGPLDGEHFTQSFALELSPGEHDLALLCCALGLIKGDWMLGNVNMTEERKGIWGEVAWNGMPLPGPWVLRPGLAGEHASVYAAGGALARWEHEQGAQDARNHPLTWWRAEFKRPQGADEESGLALDLSGMQKGIAWLNGRCIGRYWLTPAVGPSAIPHSGPIHDERIGEPTQRYYHLPLEWLGDDNVIVLFEELGGDPSSVRICSWS
jgi:beta-galactosidase